MIEISELMEFNMYVASTLTVEDKYVYIVLTVHMQKSRDKIVTFSVHILSCPNKHLVLIDTTMLILLA